MIWQRSASLQPMPQWKVQQVNNVILNVMNLRYLEIFNVIFKVYLMRYRWLT